MLNLRYNNRQLPPPTSYYKKGLKNKIEMQHTILSIQLTTNNTQQQYQHGN